MSDFESYYSKLSWRVLVNPDIWVNKKVKNNKEKLTEISKDTEKQIIRAIYELPIKKEDIEHQIHCARGFLKHTSSYDVMMFGRIAVECPFERRPEMFILKNNHQNIALKGEIYPQYKEHGVEIIIHMTRKIKIALFDKASVMIDIVNEIEQKYQNTGEKEVQAAIADTLTKNI